ncbi:MAG: TonB-dependent receptor [bacterium]
MPRLISALFIFLWIPSWSQSIISGKVLDTENNKGIEGVLIKCGDEFFLSDKNGYFTIPNDNDTLYFYHISYQQKVVVLPEVAVAEEIEVFLCASVKKLPQIIITNTKIKPIDQITLNKNKFTQLPPALGENNLLDVLKHQPGIAQPGVINSGLYIRGGSTYHNLVLMDETPVYNPYHMVPISSIFNDLIFNQVTVDHSGIDAFYDGALSGIIAIESNEADSFRLDAGISLLSSRLAINLPLKNHSSLLLGARATYFNVLTQGKAVESGIPNYHFEDLNIKYALKSGNTQLEINGFHGSDSYSENYLTKHFKIGWQNSLLNFSLRKNLDYTQYLLSTAISNYNLNLSFEDQASGSNNFLTAQIHAGLERKLGENILFKTGYFFHNHQFNYLQNFQESDNHGWHEISLRHSMYVNSQLFLTDQLILSAGIHKSYFNKQIYPSPRIAILFHSNSFNHQLSYDRTHQFLHSLPLLNYNLPFGFWIPADANNPVQKMDQIAYSFSYEHTKLKIKSGVYYRSFNNISDYKDGINPVLDLNPNQLIFGKGKSFGFENQMELITPLIGSLMINYTFSNVFHRFAEINQHKVFHPPYDIRHQINIALAKELKKDKLQLAVNWYFNSGEPFTFPQSITFVQGMNPNNAVPDAIPVYEDRYNARMPDRHQLDIMLQVDFRHRWADSHLKLGFSNIYNQANPFFIFFELEKNQEDFHSLVPRSRSLFPILPIIAYEINMR